MRSSFYKTVKGIHFKTATTDEALTLSSVET